MEFDLADLIDGQYRVVEKHRGGMSLVYIVLDEFSQKRFAIKTIKEELAGDRNAVGRFCEEAKTWMNIGRHQHVVEAIIYRDIEGQPFLWLEFVDGSDLQRLVEAEKRLLPSQVLGYGLQVCEAMSYVHTAQVRSQRGVIHRDLKPANIMVDRRMGVKITDFGLAKVYGMGRGLTDAGIGLGTYYYMPPEQFLDASSADATSDVFSFGACMYTALTGRPPTTGETVGAVINGILSKIPSPPAEVCDTVPEPLSAVVMGCLAKSRDDRFPSFGALGDALTEAFVAVNEALADEEIRKCRGCGYMTQYRYRACAICGGLFDVGPHGELATAARPDHSAPDSAPTTAGPESTAEAPEETAGVPVTSDGKEAAAALYAQALDQREAGRHRQAMALLRDAVREDPTHAEARSVMDETARQLAAEKSQRPGRSYNWTMFRGNITRNGYSPEAVLPPLRRRWQRELGEWIVSSPTVVNGTVYVGSCADRRNGRGRLSALRTQDGSTLWSADFAHEVVSSPAVLEGNTVYIASRNDLAALDCKSGEWLWEFTAVDEITGGPGAWKGMVFFGSCDRRLYAVNARTGENLWSFLTQGEIYSSPAYWDGVIYVGSSDHRLYAVDAGTGRSIWEFVSAGEILGAPAYADERVYVGSTDHRLYCIDARTGQKLWEYQTEREIHGSPAVWNGAVYIGSRDHCLYALASETGALKWRFSAGDWVNSSPLLSGGLVYCGSHDKRLYGIECESGVELWSYETGAEIESSPAASGGCVYVGSRDGSLYCFKSA